MVRLRPVIKLSDDQLFKFCQLNRDLQIEQTAKGELIIMAPTAWDSGHRELVLGTDLMNWARVHGGRVAGASAGFKLPNTAMRAPDVSWISEERFARLTKKDLQKFPPICPDFVLELRSRTDRMARLRTKMVEYIDNGARLGWLIDPIQKQVFVYRPGEPVEHLKKPGDALRRPGPGRVHARPDASLVTTPGRTARLSRPRRTMRTFIPFFTFSPMENPTEIPKAYEPAAVEAKWQARWAEAGCFTANPKRVSASRPAFSIVIPPPNITGVLTLGHVLNNTIQDILARRARQTGHEVLWLPGTDHAGSRHADRRGESVARRRKNSPATTWAARSSCAAPGNGRKSTGASSSSNSRNWAARWTGRASGSRWTNLTPPPCRGCS